MQHADTVSGRDRFAVPIKCKSCSQMGSVTWEEIRTAAGEATGRTKMLAVSSGFHTSDTLTRYGSPRIVCDRCDTPQSE